MTKPGRMLWQVLGSIFKKPATMNYPAKRQAMPDKFRGKIIFHNEKCIGCKICMKDCPAGAITIKQAGEKKFECGIDMAKCIYCAQCVDSCPRKALESTKEYELAVIDRRDLKIRFKANEGPGEAPKGQA